MPKSANLEESIRSTSCILINTVHALKNIWMTHRDDHTNPYTALHYFRVHNEYHRIVCVNIVRSK